MTVRADAQLRLVDEHDRELAVTHVRCEARVTAVRKASGLLFTCPNCGTVRKRELKAELVAKNPQTMWIREYARGGVLVPGQPGPAIEPAPWHRLLSGAEVGVTVCGLVLADGQRKPLPGAGALICERCRRGA